MGRKENFKCPKFWHTDGDTKKMLICTKLLLRLIILCSIMRRKYTILIVAMNFVLCSDNVNLNLSVATDNKKMKEEKSEWHLAELLTPIFWPRLRLISPNLLYPVRTHVCRKAICGPVIKATKASKAKNLAHLQRVLTQLN